MRGLIIAALMLATACAHQPVAVDFFAEQAEFAAQRKLETMTLDIADHEQACAHVAAVLMDLNCELVEVNSRLGVISARPGSRVVGWDWSSQRSSCGGERVTVTVTDFGGGRQSIRAAFAPPRAEADQAFTTSLRKSLKLHRED